jgi:hypothetical protein
MINGIVMGETFIENQTYKENKRLDTIIQKTLKGDYNSLRRLNHFPCGEGAGCYDKGYIITQIIYKLGEDNFSKMVNILDQKELYGMEGYIDVGLEYGDNNFDGKIDNLIFKNEFPKLYKTLKENTIP